MSTGWENYTLNYLHDVFCLRLRKLEVLVHGSYVHDGVDHAPSLLEARGCSFEENLVGDFSRPREQARDVLSNLA